MVEGAHRLHPYIAPNTLDSKVEDFVFWFFHPLLSQDDVGRLAGIIHPYQKIMLTLFALGKSICNVH